MLGGENRALVKQRADMRRIEAKHSRERVNCVARAVERDQRLTERDQGVEVIGVPLEKLDEKVERIGRAAKLAPQLRQLERRICIG